MEKTPEMFEAMGNLTVRELYSLLIPLGGGLQTGQVGLRRFVVAAPLMS